MVVLLHVSGANIHEFGPKWWSANFWDSLSRACVPAFFMISGATLLSKTETLTVFFQRRISRIALPLAFWSMFYLWWLQHNGVHTGNWILAILRGPTMYHLWYFYTAIGLYFFVPILRRFYQTSSQSEKFFFLAAWFLIASISRTAQSLCSANLAGCGNSGFAIPPEVYHLQYFAGYAGYLLLGAMLYENNRRLKEGIALFACGWSGTFIATYVISRTLGAPSELFYEYLTPFIALQAAGIFIVFMQIPKRPSPIGLRIASDCTLGVYCLHPFIIDPFFMHHGLMEMTGVRWIDPALAATGVFIVSLAIIFIARQLGPLKRVM
jgi:surface polysaccharide O-acyltransferase-like enzyme